MPKCRNAVYGKEAEAVKNRITGGKDYCINTIYTNENGFKWYENSRGYIHIINIEPCRADGRVCHILQYYRLKPNGNLVDEGYKFFMTYAEAKKAFDDIEEV